VNATPSQRKVRPARMGFTLIEIMIVVAIVGLLMGALVPTLFMSAKKDSIRKTVSDIIDVCANARARAILQGSMTEVHFYPRDRRASIGSSSGEGGANPGASTTEANWSEKITLEMLDVNLTEWKDADEARVRFYPNGTSDEMTVVLVSEKNEWRKITLEPLTGLAGFESLAR
jgi:prepilin-type N-terminal cleavage/methylation domain-containing protein